MKKIYIKNILFILVILVSINFLTNIVYADESGYSGQMKGLITTLDNTTETGGEANTKAQNIVAMVVNTARIIGVAVAIVMLLVVAMKYMTAAPGEKADIKKSAVVYVVGAFILFAVTGILGIINSFSSNIK